jgi:hypothetical protein
MEYLFWGLVALVVLWGAWRALNWAVEAVGRAPMNDG